MLLQEGSVAIVEEEEWHQSFVIVRESAESLFGEQ